MLMAPLMRLVAAESQRLRTWWRHEAQSVAAALTAARHHSADPGEKVGDEA